MRCFFSKIQLMGRLLIVFVVINAIILLSIVPIWHFPDEQAHFGQIAFMSEVGRSPDISDDKDLTEEIYISELLLGTARDKLGNNKFTFHPGYRIEYTNTLTGKYESSIVALAKTKARNTFVYREATRYSLLYYLPASFVYKLFYASNLFTRIFMIRFWSVFLFVGTVFFVYKLGQLIFSYDRISVMTLAILVGFQPMMVFANVGINSDALGNLLFAIFIFLCAKLIITGIKTKEVIFLIITIGLSIYTKPQFIITLPIVLILTVFIFIRDYAKKNYVLISLFLGFAVLLFLYLLNNYLRSYISLVFVFFDKLNLSSLFKFTWEYTIPHTIREVLPWYWGIYDWLGVTYPRIVHRIINRIIFVSLLGLLLCIYKLVKNKMWRERRIQAIIFLTLISLLYFIAISFYDWMSWYTQKYQLGVQGRYFFPLISIHMLLLLLGWRALFPQKWQLKVWGTGILGLLMIILNIYGLYTVAKTYYDLSSFSTFIIQASQYKPWFVKGNFLIFWLITYVVSILAASITLIYVAWKLKAKSQLDNLSNS